MDRTLGYVVTGFGCFMGILSFALIFLGKRIPGDTGTPQELEFKGLKMKSNAVLMLVLLSFIVVLIPLLLQGWIERHKPPAPPQSKPQDLQLYITGQVLDTEGPVEGATVTITNIKNARPGEPDNVLATRLTGGSGTFDFPALAFGEGDRYKVVAAKEGHVEQYFYMGPSGAVDVRTVLVAKRRPGGGL